MPGARSGMELNLAELKKWCEERDWKWRQLADAVLENVKPSPATHDEREKETRNVSATVRRWEKQYDDGQTVAYIISRYRDALDDLAGDASARFLRARRVETQATAPVLTGIAAAAPTEKAAETEGTLRERMEEERERYVLYSTYQEERYDRDLQKAAALSITGTNLRRIVRGGYLGQIEDVLERNGEVRVLMHHPASDVCVNAMVQDIGIDVEPCAHNQKRQSVARRQGQHLDIAQYRKLVHNNLSEFCRIRDTGNNGKKLKIRVTPIMLAFGLDACFFDHEGETGTIYVRLYPLPDFSEPHKDKPIIKVRHSDARWYGHFKKQFDLLWAPPSRGGLAMDVPDDYPWQSSWDEVSETLKEPEFPSLGQSRAGMSC